MVLNKIYMIPHGDEIIDMPDDDSVKMNNIIREICEKDISEVLVILSPHGINLSKHIGIVNTERFLSDTQLKEIHLNEYWKNERNLCEKIIHSSGEIGEEVRFVTYSGDLSVFPMDFGTSIPLYFFKKRNMVMIGQSRSLDRESLMDFGKILGETVSKYEKTVSVIFSADQAHTHSKNGPYGFSPQADIYEEIVKESIEKMDFRKLENINMDVVGEAKPDSYWNLLIMDGLLKYSGLKMQFHFGYVAEYFGMMFASSN